MKGKVKKVLSVLNGSFLSSLVEEENTLFDFLKGAFWKKKLGKPYLNKQLKSTKTSILFNLCIYILKIFTVFVLVG